MNIQALMKQANEMQKKITQSQAEIDAMNFTATSGIVTVDMNGKGIITKVSFNVEDEQQYDKDDIEMFSDSVLIAVNDCLNQLNKIKEEKLGSFTKGMQGLF